ncbi:MAG TPA: LysM peptidoglycan-binding domain-containing M23 family metallopeptidase [Myxococcota bacterium]|nr:LysM peptidoglycan-binding domain-containing M23 family metallopeptidase [Myxococcota bacterium]
MGRLAARAAPAAALLALAFGVSGCFTTPEPRGAWHVLRPGETIWRISQNYGTSVKRIVRANRIRDVKHVAAGTRLWVPGGTPPEGTGSGTPAAIRTIWRQTGPERDQALADARRNGKLHFRWPVEGRLTSRFGRRWGRKHEGLDLAAKPGTPVRAAESGRVIYAGVLGAYGNAVIVRHSQIYSTVYAHNRKLLIGKGGWVEKGDHIAEVGSTGRSTGPHLHFEVRRGKAPQDPMLYLP